MAGKGRYATSNAEKRMRGETRPSRLPTPPPIPRLDSLRRPRNLDPATRKVWDRLAPGLAEAKILDGWRVDAFVVLCRSLALHERAYEALIAADLTSAEGQKLFRTVRDCAATAHRYLESFGMSPASASRVLSEKTDDDELESILSDLKRPRGRYDPPPPGVKSKALRGLPGAPA